MRHAVIMAGGSGTRFWPASRKALPKQFLQVQGERTLLQATADRCRPLLAPENTWVITNQAYAAETQQQLPDLAAAQMLLEPVGRNTAPCIGWAAWSIAARDPEAILVVMPADHVISPAEVFQETLSQACELVTQRPETLVLLGIPPQYPATGYGYIRRGAPLTATAFATGPWEVAAFKEKPTATVAAEYLASGEYFWNSGIFIWRASTILQSLQQYEPRLWELLQQCPTDPTLPGAVEVMADLFPRMPAISIDYAVLERARSVSLIEAPFTWDDVGSWEAIARLAGADEHGNTLQGRVCALETSNSILRSTEEHLLAAYGLVDCLVVQTPTATLIAKRNDENALRQLVAELERRGWTEYL